MKIKIITFNKELEAKIDNKYKNENPDLIVPIGGDGTFIHSIQQNLDLVKNGVPVFGIANGTLNFLMNKYEFDDINKLLNKIEHKNNIEFIETRLLNYYINNEFKGVAVNEVVFGESIREYPTINLNYNQIFKRFQGSMIAIASPIGTTGLNRNIDGTIIPKLDYDLISINTIASSIKVHEVVENTEVFIRQEYERAKIPVLVDNKIVAHMNNNDVLMVKLGMKIKIGFNDLKAFEEKRILSMINN